MRAVKEFESKNLRKAIANSPVTVYGLDCNLRYKWVVNPKVAGSEKLMIGKEVGSPGKVMDVKPLIAFYKEVLKSGKSERREIRLDYGDQFSVFDIFADVEKDEKGKVIGLTATSTDITELKKAEETLTENEKRQHQLFDSLPEGLVTIEMLYENNKPVDFRFLEVNPSYARLIGKKSAQEVIGKTVREAVGVLEDYWYQLYDGVVKTGESVHYENYVKALDEFYEVVTWKTGVNKVAILCYNVTQRKKAEEAINRQRSLQQGANKILEAALKGTREELGEVCLTVAEEITGSKFGFIGDINPNGLEDIAISNPGWKACNIITAGGHRRPPGNFKIHGIYGRVLRDGRSLYTNDPSNHPDSIGLPKGHPPLKSFLGVPLQSEGKTIGMIAVADRTEGYTDDEVDCLEALAPTIVEAFARKKAEEALRKSEAEYYSLFANMMDGFAFCQMIYDEEGNPDDFIYLQINDAFERITGLKRDIVVGRKVTDAIPGIKEANPEVFDIYGRVASRMTTERFDIFFKPLNMWLSISVYCPTKGYFAAVFEDITDRKKAEEALVKSESRWSTTLSSIGDAVIATDKDGKITFMNKVAEALTGCSLAESSQKPLQEAFHIVNEETRQEVENPVSKVLRIGAIVGLANHSILVRRDGHEVPIDDSGSPIKDQNGNVTGVVLVFHDITDRRKAEEARRQVELEREKLSAIVESTDDAIIGKTLDGVITSWNKASEKLYGYNADEVIGKPISIVIPPDREVEFQQILQRLARGEKTQNHDTVRIRKDGTQLEVDVTVAPIKNSSGEIVGASTIARDITERKKADEALRESQSTLQNIIDGSPAFIFLKDKDGRFITINKLLEKSLGMKREELKGKTDYDIFPKEIADYYRKNDRQVLETKQPIQTEEAFDSPDGKKYTLLANKFPLFNSSGKVIATCSISLDITERKKAEVELKQRTEQLEQTQRRLEDKAAEVEEYATRMEELVEERTHAVKKQASLIDLSPDAILVRRFEGTISFWSAGAEKLYGWTAAEAVDHIAHKLLKTIFPEPLLSINTTLRLEGSWTGELRHKTKDGREVVVESRWRAEKDKAGKIIDILESNVDVTERKKAEAAVQSERKRLFEVLDTLPAMICLITPDYHIAFANRRFKERFGESKGRPCYEYCWGQTEPCKFCESLTPFKTGKPHHWEVTGPDGTVIEAHDYPFADVDGKQLVLEMDLDITARKKAESQAAESARKLQDAERLAAIGATAGMVGHDIRNPLQAITGDLYLMKTEVDDLPDSEGKKSIIESLEETEKNVDYINKIVQDLQDYARPLNPKIEESNLSQVFDGIIKKNGIPSNVEVIIKVSKDARELKADAYYLNRIMTNLITNAIQAMPQGGRLKIDARKEKGETVISVKDTGVGIPKDIQPKLFTVMFTTKSKGQGFGLPVVKRMTESLGGTVSFETEEGKGTKFIIRLPPPKEINGKLVFRE